MANTWCSLGVRRDVLSSGVTRWRSDSWAERHTSLASRTSASLFYFSILHRDHNRLAWAPAIIFGTGYPLVSVSDHGIFKSLSLRNLDNNCVELCRDGLGELWLGDEEANPTMGKQTLGVRIILAEFDGAACGG
ncbi:MAG TPA: hypothetical protein VNA27_15560 [Rubrobacteraceae bacterium]|nr:hypothetical protein [Rubrobacteraceae bacterium]